MARRAKLSTGLLEIGLNHALYVREERLSTRRDACRIIYISDIHLRRGRSDKLCGQVVEAVHPPPSRVEAATLAREAGKEVAERLATTEGQHGGEVAKGADERAGEETEELVRRVAPVLEGFDAQLALQQDLVDTLRFVSPAIVVSEGLVELAGSGVSRRASFISQC